ncbi:unnamed protein product [Linum trigynum]|uniref:Protein FLC EXPRESSOR n=1 Tax=Linum trigynum TaxID=586398 RepID=A0AAV2D8M5_9ROSI
MSERNHHLRRPLSPRSIDDRRLRDRLPVSVASSDRRHAHASIILEDRIAIQHHEIQSLLIEKDRLAATHVALKQELALAQQDLRHLAAAAVEVKAERDGQVRQVLERSLKLDAELRATDAMTAELVQVRGDVHTLATQREELVRELEAINRDLMKAREDADFAPGIRSEIQKLRQEIQKGRAAIDYEKKTRSSNLEHGKAMDRNRVLLAEEIDRLCAELVKAEKRARAAAANATANLDPAYGSYANHGIEYGVGPYHDQYGKPQVRGVPDGTPPLHASGSTSNGACDMVRQQPTNR